MKHDYSFPVDICGANDDADLAYASEWVGRLEAGIKNSANPDRAAIAAAISLAVEADRRLAVHFDSIGMKGNPLPRLTQAISGRDGTWIGLRLPTSLDEFLTLDRLPYLVADIVCGSPSGPPHKNSIKILQDCLKGISGPASVLGAPNSWHFFHQRCLSELGKALKTILYNAARRNQTISSIASTMTTVMNESCDKVCNDVLYFDDSGGKLSTGSVKFPFKAYHESLPKGSKKAGERTLFRASEKDALARMGAVRYASERLARHYVSERNRSAAAAANAQADIQTIFPSEPVGELQKRFLDVNLCEQNNMQEMLEQLLRRVLRENSWITRDALNRGVKYRFGERLEIMRRLEVLRPKGKENPEKDGLAEDEVADQEMTRAANLLGEGRDPEESWDFLKTETLYLLIELGAEDKIGAIIEDFWSINGISVKDRLLAPAAKEFYERELKNPASAVTWHSVKNRSDSPFIAALGEIYKKAKAAQRKLLEEAAKEGALTAVLHEIIKDEILKRYQLEVKQVES